MSAATEYVVRCGDRGLFLGIDPSPRSGCMERARKFASKADAESARDALCKRGGLFQLPWAVYEVKSQEGRAKA